MQQYDVIIIGGGLGGLTAGATLSKLGKKVFLLEQHYIPGGCATTFKRKDYVMEVGLHEMDGLFEKDSKVQIFDFLEVNKHVEFEKVPELFHIISEKLNFTFPHGTEIARNSLIEKFSPDKKGIDKFFKLINGVLDEIPKFPRKKWITSMLYPFLPILFPNIVKASRQSLGHWLDKYISNEELKLILQGNLLYYHDDPYSMSLMYFSVAQASYIGGGGHFIKGGSQQLSNYLAQVITENGGQVLLGKKAENIIITDGKVAGVSFKDSFNSTTPACEVFADAIIGNAAIPNIAEMLPTTYGSLLKKKIEHLEKSCSLISIYMGFKKELKTLGVKHYSTFIIGKGIKSQKDVKANNQGDWANKGFIFIDYSQIDSGLCPNGKSFGVICAADYFTEWESLDEEAYKKKKETVAQLFFNRLEMVYPGILNHLEYYEVSTAKTIQRYTLNPKGTPYGYAQTPQQSGIKRTTMQSPVKGLYFASAWTFPGGGFTGAILSGYLCAIEMNKNGKWKTTTKNSSVLEDERIVKLVEKKNITSNTFELVFEKPENFHFTAGQYVVVRLNNPKTNHLDLPFRKLSILSHPDEFVLRFAMRISESSFNKSCVQMKPGDAATIYGPMGNFIIDNQHKNIVFMVSGIGITPVISIIKELERINHQGRILLLYSNKTESTTAYHSLFKNVKLPNFIYEPVFTESQGRINEALLHSKVGNTADFHYFVVGTSGFLKSMKQILFSSGVELPNIHADDFG